MGPTTADALLERMAQIKADNNTRRCQTCKIIDALDPDARRLVESWFDDPDGWSPREIGDAIGIGEKSARRHRAKCRGQQD